MAKPTSVTRAFKLTLSHGYSSVSVDASVTLELDENDDPVAVGYDAASMAREWALEDMRNGRRAHDAIDAIVGGATRKLVGVQRGRRARGSGLDEDDAPPGRGDYPPPDPPPASPASKRLPAATPSPAHPHQTVAVVDDAVPPPDPPPAEPQRSTSAEPPPPVMVDAPAPEEHRVPAPGDAGVTEELFVDDRPSGSGDVDWSRWDETPRARTKDARKRNPSPEDGRE